jgi:hypothetical protein
MVESVFEEGSDDSQQRAVTHCRLPAQTLSFRQQQNRSQHSKTANLQISDATKLGIL